MARIGKLNLTKNIYPGSSVNTHRLVPVVEDLLEVADLQFLEVDVLQVDLFVVPQLAHLFILLLQLFADLKLPVTVLENNQITIINLQLPTFSTGMPHDSGLDISPRIPVAASLVPPR